MAQRLDVTYITGYTDGSAARELNPVQPFKTLRLPRFQKKRRKVICVDPISIASIAVAAVLLVAMIAGTVELMQVRRDVEVMETYVQTLQQENEILTAEYKAGYNLEDVRKTVTALGYVPMEQVEHVTMEMPAVQAVGRLSVWERVYTFLIGLFA